MSNNKRIQRELSSSRVKAITEYVNNIHSQVDALYESLMDDDIKDAIAQQRKIGTLIRTLKIENPID